MACGRAKHAVLAVRDSLLGAAAGPKNSAEHVASVAGHVLRVAQSFSSDTEVFSSRIRRDLSLLSHFAEIDGWTHDMPVPANFFELLSDFHISDELMASLCENPEQLIDVSPRDFERVVAMVLDGLGYDVGLTLPSRDGGYDILAISHRTIKEKCLVECKRYTGDRKVPVRVVRELHGVVTDIDATKGIVVTTSDVTRDAKKYIDKHKWRIEAWGFDELVRWLRQYQVERLRGSLPEKDCGGRL